MGKIMTAAQNSRKLILLPRFYAEVTETLLKEGLSRKNSTV
jgi:hypothetical protein